jgi:amidase
MEVHSDESAPPDRRTILRWGAHALAGAAVAAHAGVAHADQNLPEVVGLDARGLAKAIRSRRVSCVEVMQAYLQQIDRLNGQVNAIVALQPHDDLLRQAKACDEQLAKGDTVGPLHGFPHAVKDLAPVKGMRFTQGSLLFRDRVATADSLPVERLRKAGVIFIGKTNTPEFGLGSHTVNAVYGATHNAYDPARSAGGSSGGAAVALALRMLPLADGSDHAGSLRNPAGWNNVCGFRTSFGRVPLDAADAWTPSMGVTGPMARNVSDLALLLSIQAGYDPRAPLSMESDGSQFAGPLTANVNGKRIAFLGNLAGAVPYEPGVLDVCRSALKRFEALGCAVEEAAPAYDAERAWQAYIRLRALQQTVSFVAFAKDVEKRALLRPQAQYELALAEKLTALEISAASIVHTEWSRAVHAMFSRYDYLVAPTAQLFPFDINLPWPTEIAGVTMRTYHEWMEGVCLITLAGTPSLALPAGFSSDGLPMGIQIIAPVHQEMECLRLAAAFEAAEPLWQTRPPPSLRTL